MKDNIVKTYIISFFRTKLIMFLNICEIYKMSYNLRWWSNIYCLTKFILITSKI